jgi:hypothetical protein
MDDIKAFVRKLFNGLMPDYKLRIQTTNEEGEGIFTHAGSNHA